METKVGVWTAVSWNMSRCLMQNPLTVTTLSIINIYRQTYISIVIIIFETTQDPTMVMQQAMMHQLIDNHLTIILALTILGMKAC